MVLRSPGVPALSDLVEINELVGAASRPWLRDFLIRGGRCVYGQGLVHGLLFLFLGFLKQHPEDFESPCIQKMVFCREESPDKQTILDNLYIQQY